LNAFSQVLVVSTAEVLVCWAATGSVVETLLRSHGRLPAIVGAAMVSSILFGVYHFAHSPPFNEPGTVALLTLVGLATSTAFFASRSVYAAILFHNFLGTLGVLRALESAGGIGPLAQLQLPLIGMGLATIAMLVAVHFWINMAAREIAHVQSGRG
jgi:hypothetical protein